MRLSITGLLIIVLGFLISPASASADWTHVNTVCTFGPPGCSEIEVYLNMHANSGNPAYARQVMSNGRTYIYVWTGGGDASPVDCELYQCNEHADTGPPDCGDSAYYDPGSGECVAPDDVCYVDIVSGNLICEEIWPDESPDGCVMSEGVMLCLPDMEDEHPDTGEDCVVANGKLVCKEHPDQVCGIKNGSYQCLDYNNNAGCGYFNGVFTCIDKNGDHIPEDSPDHPKNGGNADGDDTNDPTDPRKEGEGGDPNNQPGKQAADFEGVASEKTLREIRDAVKGVGDTLKEWGGGGGGGSGPGSGPGTGDGDGDGDEQGEGGSFDGGPIDWDIDDGLERLNQVKGEYEGVINSIRGEVSTVFGSFSGGGDMSDNNIVLFDREMNAGFSKFAPYLQYMGGIILFVASFLAVGIILGGRD